MRFSNYIIWMFAMNGYAARRNQMAKIKEECGVFGIYDLDGEDVATSIYYGLTA